MDSFIGHVYIISVGKSSVAGMKARGRRTMQQRGNWQSTAIILVVRSHRRHGSMLLGDYSE
jgi:hypothetical protein